MSKYTTEVRYICESIADVDESVGFNDIEEVLDKSVNSIFDFNFPFYSEELKTEFCKKILRYFYTREIGFEVYGLWKLKLNVKLQMIMPYYNKMYESELIKFDPLHDTDLTRTHTLNRETSDNRKDNAESKFINKFSDTPQGGLKNVESGEYLTNATITESNGQNISNGNGTLDDKFTENVSGKSGSTNYSDMLIKYRKTFLKVDQMVMDELEDLFMQIW